MWGDMLVVPGAGKHTWLHDPLWGYSLVIRDHDMMVLGCPWLSWVLFDDMRLIGGRRWVYEALMGDSLRLCECQGVCWLHDMPWWYYWRCCSC